MASKGLDRIHFYVSDLSAPSQAISKGAERPELFPLDGARRLRGSPIVMVEVSGHAVGRGDGAQGQHLFIGAGVALDADRLDRQQHGEGLPDVVVQARLADLVQIDGVRVLERGDGLRRDLAGDADGQARTGERMAADEGVGQAQFPAQYAHFVLEQFAQGLDQLQLHEVRQAADVVVALDDVRGAAGRGHALDHVGVEGALGQEGGAFDLGGLAVEHLDEDAADGLALGFRVRNPGQLAEEFLRRINVHQRDVVVLAEQGRDLLGLVLAHQAGVHEDTGQLIANSFMDKQCCNGRIHTAGKRADNFAFADLFADLGDLLVAIGGHGPVAGQARHAVGEVLQQLGAARGVHHLGVELHAVDLARLIGDGGEGRAFRGGDDVEAFRQGRHAVAVAHPHRLAVIDGADAGEQGAFAGDDDLGAAELGVVAALDLTAQLFAHGLLTVANAQDRRAVVEDGAVYARAVGVGRRVGAARQDDGLRLHRRQGLARLVERMDLAIDAGLAQAARDQLRHLAAEIDDEHLLVLGRLGHEVESGASDCARVWPCRAGISRAERP
uniref:NAD-specific glutamate dehydrogenase n=1 Tax=Parastrongyloides trichosuri TaxID=131310 RepID=A0A0N4ZGT3_PARTI